MQQVTATRSELLARRAQIALAAQGRDVLKEKRDSLMAEFRATVDVAVAGSGALEEAAAEGRRALAATGLRYGADRRAARTGMGVVDLIG